MLERVDAANACRQIGNSVTASCIRSARFGNGLIDFSVGVMAVMYCPFTRLKNIYAGIRWNRCLILNLLIIFAHSVTAFFHSLFRRTSYDFQRCPLDGQDEWSVPSSPRPEFRVLLHQRDRGGCSPDRRRREQHFNEMTGMSGDGWAAQAQTRNHLAYATLDVFFSPVLCWCKLSLN